MAFALSLVVVFHLLLPLGAALWLAVGKPANLLSLGARIVVACSFNGFIVAAGSGWPWLGMYTRYLVWVLTLAATVVALMKVRGLPRLPNSATGWVSAGFLVLLALTVAAPLPWVLRAHRYEGRPVVLSSPLAPGRYVVGHGGATPLMNQHQLVDAQRYAVDIVGVGSLGFRAAGILPKQNRDYDVFASEVLAPCSGEVIGRESALADLPPPERDASHLAGNHVLLYCDDQDATLLLAHLQQGSVRPKSGEHVRRGEPVARVGNSGNTTEPHLHLHAVRGRQPDVKAVTARAVARPMLIDGRFLVRNDRFVPGPMEKPTM